MNLGSLNTLRAILVHGSFTAAGAAVGCTPSAVSLQIKQLEEFFGQPLFDRSTRVPRPTGFAVEIASAAADFGERIEALRAGPSRLLEGRFRLGVITSMQSDLLPPALRLLGQRYPALDVRVPPLNDTDELLTELRAGRIEAALLVRPENGGSSRMAWHELRRQPYVMLAPPDAPEADPRSLLANHGWIGYDTSLPGGRVAARHVRSLVPGLVCQREFRSMDAIVSMVSLGLGVTVVPQPRERLVQAYGLRVIGLGRQAPFRRIALVWRRADEGNRKVAEVVAAFRQVQEDASA
ncbi:LysR family transcriptional regulator [Xylophilus rhododendri]|uniref:LysR family transcriptional regulator n=1 Tax=Xylophilus rhododendri TaxID=2697032 RepID=A0A857J5W7_9BURK|nr:LysR family transcriptional regulator [Xylophilus rhododendri]QHI98489.1 LysR family transcriptional regulator [Xylophilus rhododendri]